MHVSHQIRLVVGSPGAVEDRLAELYEKLGGFGQLIGLFAIGPSTHEQVMRRRSYSPPT